MKLRALMGEWEGESTVLEPLRKMLAQASVEDVDVPESWPSVTCQNIGHEQRPEQHGVEGWRCPDCDSTWWAVDGTPMPAHAHLEAYVFRLAAAIPVEEG